MSPPKNLLQVFNGSKAFGSKVLFDEASFSINEDEHVGVIGPNGAGKTSLFKVLMGELELDQGDVVTSNHLRLGYLKQHDLWKAGETVEDFLKRGTRTPLWDLKKLGLELGLQEDMFTAPIESLSGGYRMRAKLLHLIGEEPNLMLLDEPTNYLDLETLLILETFLQSYQGAFLLISHDREFLRRTTDHILEIENGDFVKYNGHIDDYFDQKQLLREQLESQAATQQAKKKQILDFAARFGAKATKAKQVQSRLKHMNKMQSIELKPLPVAAKINIPEPEHTGKICLEMDHAFLGYGDKVILQDVSLKIGRGDHLGVVGYNGAGKSTFLKALAGELPLLSGDLEFGYQVKAAYFSQHVPESLNPEDSVYESLNRKAHPKVTSQEILDLAGSLLFSGEDVRKKVKVLSGGEKTRIALGQMLLKKVPLLILDEPTNHLDFFTVEALTQALKNYSGSLVLVSHDRSFIRRVATKILEVHQGEVRLFPGPYEEYVWSVQKREREPDISIPKKMAVPQSESPAPEKRSYQSISKDNREEIKELEKQKRQLSKSIKDFDQKIKIISSRMQQQTQELQTLSGEKAQQSAKEVAASQRKIEELESQTLEIMQEIEVLNKKANLLKS